MDSPEGKGLARRAWDGMLGRSRSMGIPPWPRSRACTAAGWSPGRRGSDRLLGPLAPIRRIRGAGALRDASLDHLARSGPVPPGHRAAPRRVQDPRYEGRPDGVLGGPATEGQALALVADCEYHMVVIRCTGGITDTACGDQRWRRGRRAHVRGSTAQGAAGHGSVPCRIPDELRCSGRHRGDRRHRGTAGGDVGSLRSREPAELRGTGEQAQRGGVVCDDDRTR